MADNPYTSATISDYNTNPPPDDGTTTSANQLTWAKHKTKLADPIKTFADAINAAASAAGALTVVNGDDQTNTLGGSIGFTISTLTTATGEIVVTRSLHAVGSEAGAGTDNLDVISATGVATGTQVDLLASATGEVITVRSSATGNIELINDDDLTLDVNYALGLRYNGTTWRERYRPMDKISAASETVPGIVELATDAETVTGSATGLAVTPANMVAKMSAPGAIGDATRGTAAFTTLSATGQTTITGPFDSLGIADNATETALTISAGEEVTMTLQPAFLAFRSVDDSNISGTGTVYTAVFDSERFDQASNFNVGTGIFTAPVGGRYRFSTAVQLGGDTGAVTSAELTLVTSNESYRLYFGDVVSASGFFGLSGGLLVDMDTDDTASITITVSGEATGVIDFEGNATAPLVSCFSGELVV